MMRATNSLHTFICGMLACLLVASSLQFTIANLVDDDASFRTLSLLMAEEETEDSENEEKAKKSADDDWLIGNQPVPAQITNADVNGAEVRIHFESRFREILSPPPEV